VRNNLLRDHQYGKSRFSLGRPKNSINKQCLRHSYNTDDKSLQDFKVERIWQGWKKKGGDAGGVYALQRMTWVMIPPAYDRLA
jgi:hypothetical protein